VDGEYNHKNESKDFNSNTKSVELQNQGSKSLSLERQEFNIDSEARYYSQDKNRTHGIGLGYFTRNANYSSAGDLPTQKPLENINYDDPSLRSYTSGRVQQVTISQLNYLPYPGSTENFLRLGTMAGFIRNDIDKKGRKKELTAEAKLITGWEFRLKTNGIIGFQAAWDIDNWVRKAFQNKKFNSSWDGGNFQFGLAF
jgi:hypothetical protein